MSYAPCPNCRGGGCLGCAYGSGSQRRPFQYPTFSSSNSALIHRDQVPDYRDYRDSAYKTRDASTRDLSQQSAFGFSSSSFMPREQVRNHRDSTHEARDAAIGRSRSNSHPERSGCKTCKGRSDEKQPVGQPLNHRRAQLGDSSTVNASKLPGSGVSVNDHSRQRQRSHSDVHTMLHRDHGEKKSNYSDSITPTLLHRDHGDHGEKRSNYSGNTIPTMLHRDGPTTHHSGKVSLHAGESTLNSKHDVTMASRQTKIHTMSKKEKEIQHEWAQSQLKKNGSSSSCPVGLIWLEDGTKGYRCVGGGHLVTHELLAEGKGGYYKGGAVMKIGIHMPLTGPFYGADPNFGSHGENHWRQIRLNIFGTENPTAKDKLWI